MRINVVPDIDAVVAPGDAEYFIRSSNDPHPVRTGGLIICCPGCGAHSALCFRPAIDNHPSWEWDGNREAPTLKPSLHHNNGTCGWHGYLTNGEFVPC